ncbi:hypothetical protein IU498_32270 [Nocardia beijingensis]|nr:hypothetical protein [Nocardia beijingensis]
MTSPACSTAPGPLAGSRARTRIAPVTAPSPPSPTPTATAGSCRKSPSGRPAAEPTTADRAALPQVVLTDPEIAAVGLTTEDAARAGQDVDVVDYDIGHRASESARAQRRSRPTRSAGVLPHRRSPAVQHRGLGSQPQCHRTPEERGDAARHLPAGVRLGG